VLTTRNVGLLLSLISRRVIPQICMPFLSVANMFCFSDVYLLFLL